VNLTKFVRIFLIPRPIRRKGKIFTLTLLLSFIKIRPCYGAHTKVGRGPEGPWGREGGDRINMIPNLVRFTVN